MRTGGRSLHKFDFGEASDPIRKRCQTSEIGQRIGRARPMRLLPTVSNTHCCNAGRRTMRIECFSSFGMRWRGGNTLYLFGTISIESASLGFGGRNASQARQASRSTEAAAAEEKEKEEEEEEDDDDETRACWKARAPVFLGNQLVRLSQDFCTAAAPTPNVAWPP